MRNQTRKIVASLVIVALLIGVLPMSIVNAAISVTMNNASASAGETVSITFKTVSEMKMLDAELEFTYDTTKLEFVSITKDTSAPGSASSSKPKVGLIDLSSSDPFTVLAGNIATATFKVKAGATGTANLSAEMIYTDENDNTDSAVATSVVTIKVATESISLNKTTLSMNKGDKTTLIATVNPTESTDSVTWSSSNTSVVTVNNGEVTAVGAGNATITAKAGDKTATCQVTVLNPLQSVSFDKTTLELVKGQTGELKVTYLPTDTTDDTSVVWNSSNQSVATVKDGVVTAVSAGIAEITATINGLKATCTVTVTEIPLVGISLNKQDFELYLNESETLSVIFNPENTTDDKEVVWTTSNENVVKVENGKVTAVALGKATITATVGNHSASVVITVPEVLIEGITLTADRTKLEVGETAQLELTVSPDKVTEEVVATYTSSDEDVLTVDENGKVTAVALGKATVTVSVNGKVETTLEFEVLEEVEDNTNNNEQSNATGNGQASAEGSKPSVLPATGDIAIGTMVVIAVISLAGIVLFIKKARK